MIPRRRHHIRDAILAVLLWLLLGLSLGGYYTFTWYGRAGWPLPTPETLGGLILYYFSVFNVRTEIQAAHWLVVFVLAGWCWPTLLTITAPFYQRRNVEYSWSLVQYGLASLPLALPGFYLAYLAGLTPQGWQAGHLLDVALRRATAWAPPWLSPLYLGLAMLTLGWQLYLHRSLFEISGKDAWKHLALTAMLYMLVLAGLGSIAAVPLRLWLENAPAIPGL